MEVRVVLATLLSRFWFDLAPSMGRADQVKQQIALTLKIRGGLRLTCTPHGAPAKGGGGKGGGGKGGGKGAAAGAAAAAAAAAAPAGAH